ncbi:DEAD/DEAH box helicase [Hymenobacter cellulosilyticus]|uniref:DEAD/DEAH box helicase n=1 Tax=Hymenobacter cellulosilyticus TaxID=2932248 RepID=A0A8T9QFY2_9BACT|nr:DEAD/DEAH box helicase [Hymenobacter cellulosilyticus]UOQ75311.1 DEAD/DEAH box helicase [Hymenobacter cellulosilyticus]
MLNPLGTFDALVEDLILYMRTAFNIKSPALDSRRESLLRSDRVLFRQPWVEVLTEYKSDRKITELTEEDLPGFVDSKARERFASLVSAGLIDPKHKLYTHQTAMLRESLRGKQHCVITSGTGSGKTESFLLPLFAQLVRESAGWEPVESGPAGRWWDKSLDEVLQMVRPGQSSSGLIKKARQRGHETRPAAVRALVLYPMNALVEDQMTRLRRALDSEKSTTWYEDNTGGNRIYFGRYTGQTPTSGELVANGAVQRDRVKELQHQLLKLDEDALAIVEFTKDEDRVKQTGMSAEELRSFFPRPGGSEMLTRFDMQDSPPDILITNYSMLSIMLMRDHDEAIFRKTREWLQGIDLPASLSESERQERCRRERVFHLVIDELHLYRGTPGTEVAYLLRLVLHRLGLSPDHPQLRILASSASLEESAANPGAGMSRSEQFLRDFFGVRDKSFLTISGDAGASTARHEALGTPEPGYLPWEPFANFAKSLPPTPEGRDVTASHRQELARSLACSLGWPQSQQGDTLIAAMTALMPRLRQMLQAACSVEGRLRAIPLTRVEGSSEPEGFTPLADALFGSTPTLSESREAMSGLLIARALLDEDTALWGQLPRLRFHYFFHNIQGMWAEPGFAGQTAGGELADPLGRLSSESAIRGADGAVLLEVLYCDTCGTVFHGGSRVRSDMGEWHHQLISTSPDLEGLPDSGSPSADQRSYADYGLFWPKGGQEAASLQPFNQPFLSGATGKPAGAWEPAWLHRASGRVRLGMSAPDEQPSQAQEWVAGLTFRVRESDKDKAKDMLDVGDEARQLRALAQVCPCCTAGSHHRYYAGASRRGKSSIRDFGTGFGRISQVLAKNLLLQLPATGMGRKLVVFSDSREEAARAAAELERGHHRDLMRELLVTLLGRREARSVLSLVETKPAPLRAPTGGFNLKALAAVSPA